MAGERAQAGMDRWLLSAGGGLMLFWLIFYFAAVRPAWRAEAESLAAAQTALDELAKVCQAKEGARPEPEAREALNQRNTKLDAMLAKLVNLEFQGSGQGLGDYSLDAVLRSGRDPGAYFAERRIGLKQVATECALKFVPPQVGEQFGIDVPPDQKVSEQEFRMHLVRLFVLHRFFLAAKEAGVAEVRGIQHLPAARVEGEAPERLVQFPMLLKLRVPERGLAQLLYTLQRAPESGEGRSWFCLRGFSVAVKDPRSGLVDAQLALGALFPASFLKANGLPGLEEAPSKRGGPAGFADRPPSRDPTKPN